MIVERQEIIGQMRFHDMLTWRLKPSGNRQADALAGRAINSLVHRKLAIDDDLQTLIGSVFESKALDGSMNLAALPAAGSGGSILKSMTAMLLVSPCPTSSNSSDAMLASRLQLLSTGSRVRFFPGGFLEIGNQINVVVERPILRRSSCSDGAVHSRQSRRQVGAGVR